MSHIGEQGGTPSHGEMMTTGSSSPRSSADDIALLDPPAAPTTCGTGTLRPGPAAGERPPEPGPGEPCPAAHGDPVGDLVRAAVADRPLEEVVDLITALELSPRYQSATADALRAVGVHRPVEDVARLAVLLTRPPRRPDGADEAVRAAVRSRSVEDVTRLVDLLHRAPLEPRCGQEAVRTAALGRPVTELVELIGRLADERQGAPDPGRRPPAGEGPDGTRAGDRPRRPAARGGSTGVLCGRVLRRVLGAGRRRSPHRTRDREPAAPARDPLPGRRHALPVRRPASAPEPAEVPPANARTADWPLRLTVALLACCGVAHFPPDHDGTTVRAYALALGLSAFCLAVALLLTVRPVPEALALAVLAPAASAVAALHAATGPSPRPARAMELALAPTWAAVGLAVLASLSALAALCARVDGRTSEGRTSGGRAGSPATMARVGRVTH
ncbi:hypothetical protein [Streptomyces sp. SID8352]|uniref:hypothetical protein n=1 Tax=Streptomyces sp. SID8352 TaxID=2690338 RepID=UPI00136C33D7|nr:hypothetical protein [Streptomyces sp. SID8352]